EHPLGPHAVERAVGEAQGLRVSHFEVDRQPSRLGAAPSFVYHAGTYIDARHSAARTDPLGALKRVVAEAAPQSEHAAAIAKTKTIENDRFALDDRRNLVGGLEKPQKELRILAAVDGCEIGDGFGGHGCLW